MAEKILMPRLSDTMTEGVIAAWHKKVGDTIKKGDLLAEVETDKATMELESYKDGVLLHIGTEKGGKLQVDDLLAIVGQEGEDISGLVGGSDTSASKKATSKEAPKEKEEKKPQAEAPKEKKASQPAPAASDKKAIDVAQMDEAVLMPRLSDTMESGVIAAWHKKVGDAVKKGEVLAEIETDKATMELESYKNGTLLYIGAEKGETINVNELLCIIGEKDKVDVDAIVAAVKGGEVPASDKKAPASSERKAAPAEEEKKTETATVEKQESTQNGRLKASPLARKLAKEKGVDLK